MNMIKILLITLLKAPKLTKFSPRILYSLVISVPGSKHNLLYVHGGEGGIEDLTIQYKHIQPGRQAYLYASAYSSSSDDETVVRSSARPRAHTE